MDIFDSIKDKLDDAADAGIKIGKRKEADEAKAEAKAAAVKAETEAKAAAAKVAEAKAVDNSAYKLDVDGEWGPKTVKTTQHILGIAEDGICGVETIKAIQKKVGAAVDGDWGTETSTKMQAFLGVTQDGVRGPETVKAWQTWCNKQL